MGMSKMALCRSSVSFLSLNNLPKFSNSNPLFPSKLNSNPLFPSKLMTQKRMLVGLSLRITSGGNVGCRIFCMAKKVSSRLAKMNEVLQDAEERAVHDDEPIPQITLEYVKVSFARSGGPGGQNVNKVNTKVDMRFDVAAAHWLSPRVKERILQMEKNRINSDGELVISSTKTRTQKGNIEDALSKLQAIIDAASYVPPPPSEEKKQRIRKLAAIYEQRRLKTKRFHSEKKAMRRNKGNWE